ncbi:MAG: hypothetical protein KDB22_07975 [Planctomycetales bacterium]|nr:hypothetical protein [Planctomycetales bacterium]
MRYLLLAVFFLLTQVISSATGQDTATSTEQAQSNSSAKVLIGFRIKSWHTAHINDAAKAKEHIAALKMLGCEVKVNEHSGHQDIQTQTVLWKLLALESEEQARGWINWLKSSGFEVLRSTAVKANEPQKAAGEAVQYRLATWKAQHIQQPHEAAEALVIYQALGCETKKSQHSGHTDIQVFCPEWRSVDFPNHEAAHAWQDYLTRAGFETKHQH